MAEAEAESKTKHSLPPLLPGLPDDLALRCLARLSNLACAAARSTSRSWRAALSPSTLNPIRKSSDLPSPQLLFLSLSSTSTNSHNSQFKWFMVDPLRHRCFTLSTPSSSSLSTSLLHGHAVSIYGHFFLHLIGELDDVPCVNLLRFSRKGDGSSSSSAPNSDTQADDDRVVTIGSGQLKGQEWAHEIVLVPTEEASSSTLLWPTWVGLGRCLVVAGGSLRNRATAKAMSFDGEQWKQLTPLNEPRFMAAGFVLKGKVWVVGGRCIGDSGLEMVNSGEVFVPEEQKWRSVARMWPGHLQSMEEKVPCVVAVMGRVFGLKMGSNMVVVWDEVRKGWDCLGLVGEEYVEKGFKGRIVGVGDEKLWAVTEEPVMVFELETSLESALKGATPSEMVIQTRENFGSLDWRRVDRELQLDGFERVLECTLIEV